MKGPEFGPDRDRSGSVRLIPRWLGQRWRERRLSAQSRRIETLRVDDAERLAEIHATAFARPWGADEFVSFLTESGIRLDGLFLGRAAQPAGFVITRCVLDEGEILSVALAREARGRGHSRVLLAYHLQGLAHAGIARVHLEVEEGNGPAIALYRRLGFSRRGTRVGYYARPDGSRADAHSMTIELE